MNSEKNFSLSHDIMRTWKWRWSVSKWYDAKNVLLYCSTKYFLLCIYFFLCYNPINYTYLPSFFQFSVKTHEMSWSWTLPWIITLNFQSPLRRQEEHHWHSKIWTNQKPHQFFHTSILLLFHSSQSLGFGLDKMVCIRETKTRTFLRVKIKLHGLKIKSM